MKMKKKKIKDCDSVSDDEGNILLQMPNKMYLANSFAQVRCDTRSIF